MESYGGAELVLLGMGLVLGIVHTLSPDHWVAMAPISLDAQERGWHVGLQWGLGHALGLASVGLAAYAVRDWLDVELLSEGADWLLAAVLIGVGAWGLAHVRSSEPGHGHSHGAAAQVSCPAPRASHGHVHTVMAFGVGALHGASGTGAFLVVVPTLGLERWLDVATYLVGFGAGNVLAMVGISTALGGVAARIAADRRGTRLYRRAFQTACWLAIAVGCLWLVLPERFHLH